MEPDQPQTAETSDEQQSTTRVLRSYECHFCKRGFTNAQALGGHMNIHRKDKNKLKHSSSSPTLSQPSPTAAATAANPFSISHKKNWFSSTSQDEKKPLELFDTAVPKNVNQPENTPVQDGDDVDLELRLGHVEPPVESLSENNSSNRKFF